jgi:hypothetical protein
LALLSSLILARWIIRPWETPGYQQCSRWRKEKFAKRHFNSVRARNMLARTEQRLIQVNDRPPPR